MKDVRKIDLKDVVGLKGQTILKPIHKGSVETNPLVSQPCTHNVFLLIIVTTPLPRPYRQTG